MSVFYVMGKALTSKLSCMGTGLVTQGSTQEIRARLFKTNGVVS